MHSNSASFNKIQTGQNTLWNKSFPLRILKLILIIKSQEYGHKIDRSETKTVLKIWPIISLLKIIAELIQI